MELNKLHGFIHGRIVFIKGQSAVDPNYASITLEIDKTYDININVLIKKEDLERITENLLYKKKTIEVWKGAASSGNNVHFIRFAQ